MHYRAVKKRCAVDLEKLAVHPEVDTQATLEKMGFTVAKPNLMTLARLCVGSSRYKRGVHPGEAPQVVDCSLLVKWLYGQQGVWIPRKAIQQRECGSEVRLEDVRAGDLLFTTGAIDYYRDDPRDGVGHVGMVTHKNTVIHAASESAGVIEVSIEQFIGSRLFRGARRYVENFETLAVLCVPRHLEVETSDDVLWLMFAFMSTQTHAQ